VRALGRWLFALLSVLAFASLILVLAVAGLAWWTVSSLGERRAVTVPESVVLTADWRGGVPEKSRGPTPFGALGLLQGPALPDVLRALERAADDPRVAGLVVQMDGSGFGFAQAYELRQAVERLNEAGKFTAVHADSLGELGGGMLATYLATAFDHVQLQPVGSVGLTGLAAEQPYFERLLADLDVEMQVVKREAFKSALESFTRSEPSPENAAMTERLLTGLAGELAGGVAAGRGLDLAAVRAAVEAGPLTGEAARARDLVDTLDHAPAMVERAEEATGTSERMPLAAYFNSDAFAPVADAPVVGFVHAVGPIRRGESADPFGAVEIAGDTVASAIDAAREAEVDALLLRVSSPGGSAVASETVAGAIRRAKAAGIPVIVSMGDVAASGGYWIAMDADRILAAPTTLTGSIGVILGKPALDAFLTDLGIDVATTRTAANATLGSVFEAWSDADLERINALVDDLYQQFLMGVARGRGMELEEVRAAAGGRVWLGTEAAERGLVDDIGGFTEAVAAVRDVLGLEADAALSLEPYPRPQRRLRLALKTLDRFMRAAAAIDGFWGRLGAPGGELRLDARPLPVSPRG